MCSAIPGTLPAGNLTLDYGTPLPEPVPNDNNDEKKRNNCNNNSSSKLPHPNKASKKSSLKPREAAMTYKRNTPYSSPPTRALKAHSKSRL